MQVSPRGRRAALIHWIKCRSLSEKKLFVRRCKIVYLRKQGEAVSFRTGSVSVKMFTSYFFFSPLYFQDKLTSVIAEIAAKTSWKINLRVFEIPEWIGSARLVWACVYLFSNCRRDRGHVDSIGICFVFRYRHHEGALAAAAKKWDKPETAVRSPFFCGNQKACLSRRQVICFIICYRGAASYVCFS